MTFPISSPVTGAAVTGLTSATYSLSSDAGPNLNSSQTYVSALGGTQTGVLPHSAGAPFTVTWERPAAYKAADEGILAAAGLISRIGKNTYKLRTRKSGDVNTLGGRAIAMVETVITVPVNMTEVDEVELAAMLSCHFGAVYGSSTAIYTAIMNNTI